MRIVLYQYKEKVAKRLIHHKEKCKKSLRKKQIKYKLNKKK